MQDPSAMRSLDIFTDGSFDARGKTGAWAFVVKDAGLVVHQESVRASGTSNNAFELLAVCNAAAWSETQAAGRRCMISTDSVYVVEGWTRWRPIWRNNGWKRITAHAHARRRPIPDLQLWQDLDARLLRAAWIEVRWCKGHSGIDGNEQADRLANAVRAGG